MAQTNASGHLVGKTCPYCQTPVKPGVELIVCPVCGIPHHAECWAENGSRCTTFGCPGHSEIQAAEYAAGANGSSLVTCPLCGTANRLDANRNSLDARCGKCQAQLYPRGNMTLLGIDADYHPQEIVANLLVAASLGVIVFNLHNVFFANEMLDLIAKGTSGLRLALQRIATKAETADILNSMVIVAWWALLLRWTYRAHKNLDRIGHFPVARSHHWAWGGYLVPIVALWKPYQVLKEIWINGAPRSRQHGPGVDEPVWLIRIWWGVVILNILSERFFNMGMEKIAASPQSLKSVLVDTMFSSFFAVVSAALTAVVVLKVKQRQQERFREM